MYKAFYEVSSLYPYYYHVSIVWYENETAQLIDRCDFDTWKDVIAYAERYNASLVFDGLI